MAGQAGRNQGVTGLIDFDSPTLPAIQVEVQGFAHALLADIVDITGPASNYIRQYYGSNTSGTFTASGKIVSKRRPYPPTLHNLQGTLTHQQDTGCTIAFTALVENLSCKADKKAADTWVVTITGRKTGAETVVWPGGTYSYTQPTLATKELFDGTSKVTDPNALITGYVVKYFLPIPAVVSPAAANYTDAAGHAAVSAWIAASTPPTTGLKVHDATLVRLDDGAGILLVNWQLKDTVDEQEIPPTYTLTDPEHLTSEAAVAEVDTTPTLPAGFAERGTRVNLIVPGRPLTTKIGGLRTTAEDIEFPGSKVEVDPADLETQGVQTTVHDTSSPPSNPAPPTHTKIVNKWTIELTSAGTAQSQTVWNFAPQTSVDKIEQGESLRSTDALGLESKAKITVVDGSPATPSGFVARVTNERDLSDWHTATSVEYGVRTTVEDIEFPGTFDEVDPADLDTKGRKTTVHDTDTPPSDPVPPTHNKIIAKITTELTSSTGKSQTAWLFAPQTSVDKIEQGESVIATDSNGLESKARVTAVDGTPSTPSGLVARVSNARDLNDWHTATTIEFGVRTTVEDVEFPGTFTEIDPEAIDSSGKKTTVHATASPPSDPTPPSGTKIIGKVTNSKLTSAGTAKSQTVWTFGTNTSKDKIERGSRFLTVDDNGQESEARITLVDAAQPATPAAPDATVKIVAVTSREVTDDLNAYSFNYGVEDSKDKLERTEIVTDPTGLDHQAKIPVFDGSPSAPVSPAGLVLVESQDKVLPNGHTLTTGIYGTRNNQNRVEYDGSEVIIGAATGDNWERKVEFADCDESDTLEDLADAKWSAVKTTTSPTQAYPWHSLRARRYHATKVIFVTTWAIPGLVILPPTDKIRIRGSLTGKKFKSWISFAGATPKLWVAASVQRGTSQYIIQLAQQEVMAVGGPLYVTKRITGATPALGTSSILKVNSSPQFGFPIGSVMYLGASYDIVITDTSSTYDMTYIFDVLFGSNFVGFPTVTGIPPGGLIYAASSETPGLVAGSGGPPTYTWSNMNVQVDVPDTDAFSFTSWTQ